MCVRFLFDEFSFKPQPLSLCVGPRHAVGRNRFWMRRRMRGTPERRPRATPRRARSRPSDARATVRRRRSSRSGGRRFSLGSRSVLGSRWVLVRVDRRERRADRPVLSLPRARERRDVDRDERDVFDVARTRALGRGVRVRALLHPVGARDVSFVEPAGGRHRRRSGW